MNQELYAIRGEYVTLQKQNEQLATQIKAMQYGCEKTMKKLGYISNHPTSTPISMEEMEEMLQLLVAIKPLLQEFHLNYARLKELKPLTGL